MTILSIFLVGLGIMIGLLLLTGLVVLVLKIGVIVNKAGEPAHMDQGVYTIDQGREVKDEPQNQGRF